MDVLSRFCIARRRVLQSADRRDGYLKSLTGATFRVFIRSYLRGSDMKKKFDEFHTAISDHRVGYVDAP